MNIIQKKSIKIINRKPIYTSMTEIDLDIENLYDRFDTLNKNYLIHAIHNKNELVIVLCSDFLDLVKHTGYKNNARFYVNIKTLSRHY
jgi:hypothetical protein